MSKIRAEHLGKQALIYVRQSTLIQVRKNVGSKARQYDLVKRARDLGWAEAQIEVIDQDQGHSGASAEGRDGFQQMVAEVGMGHVGAIFSLEVSRLARSSSDWYRLLEICALTKTLVVDEEAIYDPSNHNDRLLLGFKGTMSEAELYWLRSRLNGGRLKKAESGKLRLDLPTGLVYDNAGKIVLDPDEAVRQAVRLLFETFASAGSARAVVRHFRQHELRFPTRELRGPRKGELHWQRLKPSRVSNVLHNPLYAGAYVYGRTEVQMEPRPGQIRPVAKRVRRKNPEDWEVLLREAHPGYISWDQYLRNQQRLEDNRTDRRESRGPAREGAALLQGIVICGKCGRRMSLRYRDHTHYYRCQLAYQEYGEPLCQFIRGEEVDAEVAALLLEAMNPAQLSVSLQALEEVEAHIKQIERQWELRIERARYEAALARRRYTVVDPENRLVARSLEHEGTKPAFVVKRNDDFDLNDVSGFDKIIFSPGPDVPKEGDPMWQILENYKAFKSILGICLGFQSIGMYFGARLYNLQKVYHGQQRKIEILDQTEPLFKNISSPFTGGLYHSWGIAYDGFPDELLVTAKSDENRIMAIRHKTLDIRGVQFHPESIMTPEGEKMIENWINS